MNNLAAPIGQQAPSHLSFEPDILISFQYHRVFRQKSQMIPEEKLMFAVLTDAIECFQRYAGTTEENNRGLYDDAAAWIASRDTAWPYSFENICETLRLSPSHLRLGLTQWRNNRMHRQARTKQLREPLRYQYRVRHCRVSLDERPERS